MTTSRIPMTALQIISKLLNCKELKVSDFRLDESCMTLHLWVQPYKNGARCPVCNRRSELITNEDRKERVWRDAPLGEWDVMLHYCPREVQCLTHGRVQEKIPWAAPRARVTYRFDFLLLSYATVMTLKAASSLLRIPLSTFSDILHRCIDRYRSGHEIKGLRAIGIDEISYSKGRKFATIVYDLDRSCVVWIGKGKGRSTIDEFFEKHLEESDRNTIIIASCDMGEAYIGAIECYCKNATLILDRFHVVKALNEAVDEVRKEQWRILKGAERKAMKGLRWLLYRHSKTRSKRDTRILNDLKLSNNRIYRAWVLKDEFEQLWDYVYTKPARDFLEAWITKVLRSRIDSMKKFARTIRRHFERIVTFCRTRVTNATAEGLNRVIRLIKNRAGGFYNLKVFSDMVFLAVGDLDIPAQIPANFRTRQLNLGTPRRAS